MGEIEDHEDHEQPTEADVDEDAGLFSPQLYLYFGVISVFGAIFLLPALGLIAVYCGYKLHRFKPTNIWSGIVIGAGGVQVFNWTVFVIFM